MRWDAVPHRWAEEHAEQELGSSLSPDRISELLSNVPIFHLEMTVDIRRYRWHWLDNNFWPLIPHYPWGVEPGEWLELHFEQIRGGSVLSYSSALAEPIEGNVAGVPANTRLTKFLDALNPSVIHAIRDDPTLHATLSGLPRPLHFAVLDIGQGSSNVMLDGKGRPIFYFDVGRGIYGNKHTLLGKAEFCTCPREKLRPPVLLSHWDFDHWAGAVDDPDLLECIWITPPPTTVKHASFQSDVINAGGTVIQLGPGFSNLTFGAGNHSTLLHCTGPSWSRNDSGNALVIKGDAGRWLFPGDASYKHIPLMDDWTFIAVVATHHGANFKGAVPPSANNYTRLLYSFGPNNTHGKTLVVHPVPNAVAQYHFQWPHTNWLVPGVSPGSVAPSAAEGVRVTAINDSAGTHLGSVLVGWGPTAPSIVFPVGAKCPNCNKSFNISQS